MHVQDIYIFKIHTSSRYIHLQDIYKFNIYRSSRYIHLPDIKILNIYTCSRYIHVEDIYMMNIYTIYMQHTYNMSKKTHTIVHKMDLYMVCLRIHLL